MKNRTLITFAIVNKHPIQSKLPRGRIRSGSQCEGTGHHSQGGMFFFCGGRTQWPLALIRETGKQIPNRKWGWTVSTPPFPNDTYFSKVLLPAQTAPPARASIQTLEPMGWVTINYFSCGCDTILSGNILIITGGEEAFLLTPGLQAQSIVIYDI